MPPGAICYNRVMGKKHSTIRHMGALALGMALFGLAACNGGGTPSTPAPTKPCVSPVTVQVLYPQPGATAVPATLTTIYVATSAAFPSDSNNAWDTELVGPPTYGVQFTAQFTATTASALPAGSATPSMANPLYYSTALSNALVTGSGFSIYINNLNDAACYAVGTGATALSSFST